MFQRTKKLPHRRWGSEIAWWIALLWPEATALQPERPFCLATIAVDFSIMVAGMGLGEYCIHVTVPGSVCLASLACAPSFTLSQH